MPTDTRHALLIVAACGIGKSRFVQKRLPEIAPNATVTILFPTIALMQEAADRYASATGRQPAVLLGIDHADCPDPRRREIRGLMARRLPYRGRVCAACPKFSGCDFHASRRAAQAAPVVFATIQLATQHPAFFARYARDVVVFEENTYDELVQRFEIREMDIPRIRRIGGVLERSTARKFDALVSRLESALRDRRDLSWRELWQGVRWTQADSDAYDAALSLAKLNALNILPWLRNVRRHRTDLRLRQGRLVGWRWVELPDDRVYVVLDATADPEIVAATLRAKVEIVGIDGTIMRTTKVIQNITHSYSKDGLGSVHQQEQLVTDVRLYLEDCRAHRRRPALVVRPSMVAGRTADGLDDDFRLIPALEALGYRVRVLHEAVCPEDISPDEIPVVTYRRERGTNVLLALGCTDVMVIGVLRPALQDVIDRTRILFGLRETDQELARFAPRITQTARTRLGREATWWCSGYAHPKVRLVYRHMVVAPVVQAAERIRSLLDAVDPRIEKRIFLDLQEDVSNWLPPDFVGTREARNRVWFRAPTESSN